MVGKSPTPSPVQHVVAGPLNWSEIIHFPKLARACVIALQPARITMGLIIIIILVLGGGLYDYLALTTADNADNLQLTVGTGKLTSPAATQGPFERASRISLGTLQKAAHEFTQLKFIDALTRVFSLPSILVDHLYEKDKLFLILFGIYFLIVWCIGSTTLCRSAAFEFALRQQLHWTDALVFSLRRWTSTLGAFLLPLLLIISAGILLGIGGMSLRVPGLNILGALLFGLALFGGFVIVCVKFLTIFGAVLFIPAVAVDSADAPDALARGFSYVKNRPLHFFLYLFSATFLGLLTLAVVLFLANQTLTWTAATAQLFLESDLARHADPATSPWESAKPGDNITAPTGTIGIAAAIISVWRTLVGVVVAGFVVSYLCSAQTVIYFLIRKATDDQDLDEIWIDGMIEGTLAPSRVVPHGSE